MPRWTTAESDSGLTTDEWLPAHPYGAFLELPESRRSLYLERFRSRGAAGGWLIECTSAPTDVVWLRQALSRDYVVLRTFVSDHWRATRYSSR
jgi:hypothetical protein